MKRLLVLAMSVAATAGCGDSIDQTESLANTSASGITYVEEYGFCAITCFFELELAPSGIGHVVVRERRGGDVRLDRTFALSAGERARLFALAKAAAAGPWEPLYGCPDCADQGRLELSFAAGGSRRETVLDPTEHPATFDTLLATLKAVLVRERVE